MNKELLRLAQQEDCWSLDRFNLPQWRECDPYTHWEHYVPEAIAAGWDDLHIDAKLAIFLLACCKMEADNAAADREFYAD